MTRCLIAVVGGVTMIVGTFGCATARSAPPVSVLRARTVSPDQLDRPPALVQVTNPRYPPAAYRLGLEGVVELEIVIDETGGVPEARVVKSIPALDAAAIDCVREWRFRPAEVSGRPVATTAAAPVVFRLSNAR